jgi:hypothetical protein
LWSLIEVAGVNYLIPIDAVLESATSTYRTRQSPSMESMFKAAAFTSVVRFNDLGATAMKRAVRDFSDTAQDADIAQRGGLIGFLSLIRSAARPSPPTAARWHPHRPSRSARKT